MPSKTRQPYSVVFFSPLLPFLYNVSMFGYPQSIGQLSQPILRLLRCSDPGAGLASLATEAQLAHDGFPVSPLLHDGERGGCFRASLGTWEAHAPRKMLLAMLRRGGSSS